MPGKPTILKPDFFERPSLVVARELLGKFLVNGDPNYPNYHPNLRIRTPYRKTHPNLNGGDPDIRTHLNNPNKATSLAGMITEVEAYVGPEDKASHASRGLTPRTKVMFGKPGYWYVYLIYGMHCCLNIVTEQEGYPAAILIRSICANYTDNNRSLATCVDHIKGPGRVCKYFEIDKRFNAKPANKKTGLWVEDRGVRIPDRAIKRGKRIGVDYAGEWKEKPWRFYLSD